MKTKHLLIAILMAALVLTCACAKNKSNNESGFEEMTEATTAATTETTETTVATEQTTAATVTTEAEIQKPEKYTGTFTEFASSNRTNLKIDINGSTYTAKLNVANNENLKDVPLGEYTASFAYADIKPDETGNQAVRTTVKGNGKSYDMVIIFYVEDETTSSLTIKLNNSELELMSGSPVSE